MILDSTKGKGLSGDFIIYTLSNGGMAILDDVGKLVAYNKNGIPNTRHWDWVRKDFQK